MTWLRRLVEELTDQESEYGVRTTTLNGERVKSKAEAKIADYFAEQKIAYNYEKTEKTNDLIFKETISKPDFYLRDYDIYVEYWGLLNSRKKSSYKRLMQYKKKKYRENKIKLIELYPNNLDNLDSVFRARFKIVAGFDLPRVPKKMNNVVVSTYCTKCGKPIDAGSRFCANCGNRV